MRRASLPAPPRRIPELLRLDRAWPGSLAGLGSPHIHPQTGCVAVWIPMMGLAQLSWCGALWRPSLICDEHNRLKQQVSVSY